MLYFYRLGSHSWCPVSMSLINCQIRYVCVVDFTRFGFFLESTPGETLWRKPSSSVLWACLATWPIQRQWSLWILLTLRQKVRVQFDWSCMVYIYQLCCCQITWIKVYACVPIFSKGDDMESLLFHFLDDWLYKFSVQPFFVPRVRRSISDELFFFIFSLNKQ